MPFYGAVIYYSSYFLICAGAICSFYSCHSGTVCIGVLSLSLVHIVSIRPWQYTYILMNDSRIQLVFRQHANAAAII